ncbi:MAG: hypothetical protein HQK94_05060 [Nitrospirae bacterium]|nr:hypothetical protein [Nitrospirota bacterium]MBF0536122.1 hypothetical protein [Nitrospirota bacterium]
MVFPVLFAFVLITLELKKVDDLYKKFEVIEAIDDAGIVVLELRRHEKNVLIFNREKEHLRLFHDNIKSLKRKLRELDIDISATLGKETKEALTAVVNKYEEDFHLAIENINERSLLVEQIRPLGREIEHLLKNNELSFKLRRFEKNFIIYRDESDAKEVQIISERLINNQLQPDVATLVKQYRSTFNKIVDNFNKQDEILHEMRVNARKIEKIILDLSFRQRNYMNLLLKNGKIPFFVTFLALLVSTVFIGYLFSYGFLRTLDNMQRTLSKVKDSRFSYILVKDVTPELGPFIETYNQVIGSINYNVDRAEGLVERGDAKLQQIDTILKKINRILPAAEKFKHYRINPYKVKVNESGILRKVERVTRHTKLKINTRLRGIL